MRPGVAWRHATGYGGFCGVAQKRLQNCFHWADYGQWHGDKGVLSVEHKDISFHVVQIIRRGHFVWTYQSLGRSTVKRWQLRTLSGRSIFDFALQNVPSSRNSVRVANRAAQSAKSARSPSL